MLRSGSLTHPEFKFVYTQYKVERHKQKQFLAFFIETTPEFNYNYGQGHG